MTTEVNINNRSSRGKLKTIKRRAKWIISYSWRLLLDIFLYAEWMILYILHANFRQITDNCVFVVGCGHSGTTLLLRVVGAHPNFHAILDESYAFCFDTRLPPRRTGNYVLRLIRYLGRSRKLAQFDIATFKANNRRWIEKTPHHIYYIEDILKKRPKAKILLIIRDGRDVAVSFRNTNGDFEFSVNRWIEDNKVAEKWWNHRQVFVLRYESLIDRFRETVTDIMAFLGEEFSEQCGYYHQHYTDREDVRTKQPSEFGAANTEFRKWEVQQPLMDRRGRWINGMTDNEKRLFKELAGKMLIEYGYASDFQW